MPDAEERKLSSLQLGVCFALLVCLFLLVEGPMWRHPWDLDAVNTAIVLSYLPIPVLVVACLAWSHKLGWGSFLLETLRVTLLKYGATFSIALVFWTLTEAPRVAIAAHPAARSRAASTSSIGLVASERVARVTGTLRGRVLDREGSPRSGALVFVSSGLDGYAYDTPEEPLLLENDGRGIVPRVAVAQVRQPILARSTDGRLHTLVAEIGGESLFNVPSMRSGISSRVVVDEAHAPARLSCTVHPGEERPAWLVVLAHPFFSTTDADGHFELRRVPSGRIELTSVHADAGEATATVELDTEAELSLRLAQR